MIFILLWENIILISNIDYNEPNRDDIEITPNDYYMIIYKGCLNNIQECINTTKSINRGLMLKGLKISAEKGYIKYEEHNNEYFNLSKKDFLFIFASKVFKNANEKKTNNDEPNSKKTKECEEPVCAICIEKEKVLETNCGHYICEKCLPQLDNFNCPMCRTSLIMLNGIAL
jgi:hypothetical protein